MAFGQVLRERRMALGHSQERLALDAGVNRNFVSLIETGQNQPSVTTLFKLAEALGTSPSDLIFATERKVIGGLEPEAC